ncbi:hypothetical protein B0H19DRAFT_917802, partial [Mycena capillaripes]
QVRDGVLMPEGDGNWDVLRYPGQNRFLNVLVCLKWWRRAMDAHRTRGSRWWQM